jgi:hypothetical protein
VKLIIDIPDILMKYIVNGRDLSEEQNDEMALAIAHGTPLPKGHGRLIDADDYKKNVCTYQQTGCGDCKHSLCCPEDAPTIIEADKAKSEVSE